MFDLYLGICAFGCLLQAVFIITDLKGNKKTASILKGVAAICFVLCGLIGLTGYMSNKYADPITVMYASLICIGLVFGASGDIFLAIRHTLVKGSKRYNRFFIIGIGMFFIGHIFYTASVIVSGAQYWYIWMLVSVLITSIGLHFFYKILHAKPIFKIVGHVYCWLLISLVLIAFSRVGYFMTVGINIFSGLALPATIFSFGILFFAISDILMVYNSFGLKKSSIVRVLNLSMYYIGQMMIAASLLCL